MKRLLCLMGMPYSGKTTIANEIKNISRLPLISVSTILSNEALNLGVHLHKSNRKAMEQFAYYINLPNIVVEYINKTNGDTIILDRIRDLEMYNKLKENFNLLLVDVCRPLDDIIEVHKIDLFYELLNTNEIELYKKLVNHLKFKNNVLTIVNTSTTNVTDIAKFILYYYNIIY